MGWLPQKYSQFFESVSYGALMLLPEHRQANRVFLDTVFEALKQEEHLTSADLDHLDTLMSVSDRLKLPEWQTIQDLVEVEAFVIRCLPGLKPDNIRHCLRYIYYLLSRHGRIPIEAYSTMWFAIWQAVNRFPIGEQPLVSNFIGWMIKNQFSPTSIRDRIRELYAFKRWLGRQNIGNMADLSQDIAAKYLHERSVGCNIRTCQKIGVQLQTFLDYYRECVDGSLLPFSLSRFQSSFGHGMDASSAEVTRLWDALKAGNLPAEVALMLIFVLGMGLPIKVLPLLRVSSQTGKLIYTFQRPNRQGRQDYTITVPLDEPWIKAYWIAYLNNRSAPSSYSYLFTSNPGIKKQQPVSVEYCRRMVQRLALKTLGYSISANRLERGSLKAIAGKLGLDSFLGRVQCVPLSKRTKLMFWLQQYRRVPAVFKPRYHVRKPDVLLPEKKATEPANLASLRTPDELKSLLSLSRGLYFTDRCSIMTL